MHEIPSCHVLVVVHGCASLIRTVVLHSPFTHSRQTPAARRSDACQCTSLHRCHPAALGQHSQAVPARWPPPLHEAGQAQVPTAHGETEAPAPVPQQGRMQQRVCSCMSKQPPRHGLPLYGETWVGLVGCIRTSQSIPESAPARPTGGRSSSSAVPSAAPSPSPADAASSASMRPQGMIGSSARHAA